MANCPSLILDRVFCLVRSLQYTELFYCTNSLDSWMTRRGFQILISLGLLYLVYLILKFSRAPMPSWISSYLADLLCMPLLLMLTLILLRYIKRMPYLLLTWPHVIFSFVYVSLIFEGYLPRISSNYTADLLDVLLYAFGTSVYMILQPRLFLSFKANEQSSSQ